MAPFRTALLVLVLMLIAGVRLCAGFDTTGSDWTWHYVLNAQGALAQFTACTPRLMELATGTSLHNWWHVGAQALSYVATVYTHSMWSDHSALIISDKQKQEFLFELKDELQA